MTVVAHLKQCECLLNICCWYSPTKSSTHYLWQKNDIR